MNDVKERPHEWSRMSKTRIRIQRGVHVMLRKISIALVTAVALGGASLAPAPASARGFGGGWHGGGYGFRSFSYGNSYNSYNSYNGYNSESDSNYRHSDRR
jgi:hypothetical protein